ncbi:hypothetical protein F5Y16DRAFT_12758 [Xylariaceae sp. FL0255]|nr:hypothetical protein F5Y16DRAFT_12758 [Xylariaceae sp. FL0255]
MSKRQTIDAYFGGSPATKRARTDAKDDDPAEATIGWETQVQPVVRNKISNGIMRFAHQDLDPQPEPSGYTNHTSYPFSIPHLPEDLAAELCAGPEHAGRSINDQPDLDLLYFEPFIPRSSARRLFSFLRSELPFYRVEYDISRGGSKTHIRTPRWTTVFGVDETAHFLKSPSDTIQVTEVVDAHTKKPIPVGQGNTAKGPGYRATPRPIPECLDVLRRSAEEATGCRFNFCLVNYYASGADSISFHSDDERFLGELPAIASFSLGARRDFLMKHKPPATSTKPAPTETQVKGEKPALGKDSKPLKLPLASGDMILMRGMTQANWLHSIPKRSGKNEPDGGRINITFRQAMVRGGTENYYNYNVGSGPVFKWNARSNEMIQWESPP